MWFEFIESYSGKGPWKTSSLTPGTRQEGWKTSVTKPSRLRVPVDLPKGWAVWIYVGCTELGLHAMAAVVNMWKNFFFKKNVIFYFYFFQISDSDLLYWRELVSKCLADYASPACCKPDHKKLVWIVSRRTAQNLQNSYYSVPELPTIPEAGCFDESER